MGLAGPKERKRITCRVNSQPNEKEDSAQERVAIKKSWLGMGKRNGDGTWQKRKGGAIKENQILPN